MTDSHAGGCFCGAVRYAAEGAPLNVRVCHCRICQRTTGAAFFARAMFPRAKVSVTGETVATPSSHRLNRVRCAHCGTPLFAEPIDLPETISVNLVTLDDPNALKPTMHIWTSSKLAWVVLADGLPQYPEGPPA
ncbi:MAG TPA: GFA family protein [Caulobacteraceae bacterium]|nr:GFA family protein [Caulobacteraceae bacterium]